MTTDDISNFNKLNPLASDNFDVACYHFLSKYLDEDFATNINYYDLFKEIASDQINLINIKFDDKDLFKLHCTTKKETYDLDMNDLSKLIEKNSIINIYIDNNIIVPFVVYNTKHHDICIVLFYPNKYTSSNEYYKPYDGVTIKNINKQPDTNTSKKLLYHIFKLYQWCYIRPLSITRDHTDTFLINSSNYYISTFILMTNNISAFFNCDVIDILSKINDINKIRLNENNTWTTYNITEGYKKITELYKNTLDKPFGEAVKFTNYHAAYNYPLIFQNVLNEYFKKNNQFNITHINQFNFNATSKITLNANVLKSIILHTIKDMDKNTLYATNQSDNSLSDSLNKNNYWFPIYWSIVFYNIMTNDKSDSYYNSIQNQITLFSQTISQNATPANLNELFKSNINTYINIVNLLYKCVSINILDKTLFDMLNNDINSMGNILLHFKDMEIQNIPMLSLLQHLSSDIQLNTNNLPKLSYEYFVKKEYPSNINKSDVHIIFLYKLYCYLEYNKIEYFKKHINKIDRPHDHRYEMYDDIYKIFNKYVELCNLDATKYYNYIPMYYFYAKWVSGYVKNQTNDNTGIPNIDLTDDAAMNKFCIFLHKYDLFLTCNNIATLITNDTKNNNILILTHDIFCGKQPFLYNPLEHIPQINFYYPPALYLFYPVTDGCTTFDFEYHPFNIQMFKNSIAYFLHNPIMMYNNPNNHTSELYHNDYVYFYRGCQMLIKYLIYDIDNDKTLKNNLIYFFYEQYENQNKYKHIKIDTDQYLNMIILLLNKNALFLNTFSGSYEYRYKHLKIDTPNYMYMHNTYSNVQPDINFNDTYNDLSKPKILNYITDIKERLINKNKQIPTNAQIVDSIIQNSHEYTIDIDKYVVIIKKFIPDVVFNNNNIMLEGNLYKYISFVNSYTYNKYLNVPICSISNNTDTLYSFYNDFYLKFKYIEPNMQITDIYIDGMQMVPDPGKLPFFYLLPKNGVYFVYFKNNMYHIRYFIKSTNSSLLITINPYNLFFPNPFTNITDYNIFMDLCIEYGITNYNYIYINKHDIKQSHVLNYINDIVPKINLKAQLNDIDYIKINTNKINKNRYINVINKHIHDSSIALLNKITNCNINSSNKQLFNNNFTLLINNANKIIAGFIENIPTYYKSGYSELFEKYNQLYKYLLYSKINNACKSLINTDDANLCNQIKIFNERFTLKSKKFNYLYEAFFEFYTGIELTEEQFNRYHQIISNYENWVNAPSYKLNDKNMTNIINFTNIQKGGNFSNIQYGGNFPLHHLMMGKGKSAVLTPLLTLYFTLMHNKTVYIIVPTHLVKQTELTIKPIASVFNISNKIIIKSEYEIKEMYLNKVFHDMNDNTKELIFLIDEFDYILDPLKSNFNVILNYKQHTGLIDVINIVRHFIQNYKKMIDKGEPVDITKVSTMIHDKTILNFGLYRSDFTNIMTQIMNNTLKKNINWGIHPTKCYAIPFMNKDKIFDDCNFTSHTLIIFLTFFNYIIEKNNVDFDSLVVYIKTNKLSKTNYDTDDQLKNDLINDTNNCYTDLINHIVKTLELPATQLNTSFIDILNIKNVYKIGYSGTLNIELPTEQNNIDQFTKNDIVGDNDERKNVTYAIKKSNIIVFTNAQKPKYQYNKQITELNEFFIETVLESYDALIDEAGLFKNIKNIKIAEKLYNDTFKQSRPIIFLTESDDKMVLYNNSVTKYDPYLNLTKPFIYYSQSHTIGVDINQDNYPTLKGLCIIDDHSKYTTIAQAIFRLRKLNMGHTIDFYHINWVTPNKPSNLIKQFNDKDNENKINKRPSLLYQTFKSLYRTILKNNPLDDFKKIHTEEIKYYYTGEFTTYTPSTNVTNISQSFSNYFSGILDDAFSKMHSNSILRHIMIELQTYNTTERDIFSELVFNIVTTGLQISRQTEKQTTNTNFISQQENALINQQYINNEHITKTNNVAIISLIFKHEILANIDETNYKKYALQLDEYANIYYLPNIFCNHSSFQYTENMSGIVCVYINNSMLLIPFYCFLYFIKYPMFNLQLNWFYGNSKFDEKSVEKFKNTIFFKIMNINTNNTEINIESLFAPSNSYPGKIDKLGTYIIYTQIIGQCVLSEIQFKILKIVNEIYSQSIINEYDHMWSLEAHITRLITQQITNKQLYVTYLVPSTLTKSRLVSDIYTVLRQTSLNGGYKSNILQPTDGYNSNILQPTDGYNSNILQQTSLNGGYMLDDIYYNKYLKYKKKYNELKLKL